MVPVDPATLCRDARLAMAAAGDEVVGWDHVLTRTGDTVVSEVTGRVRPIREWDHYPPGDVFDADSRAQYYFHIHPPEERPPGEIGHFHTFLRGPAGTGAVSHLVAIGVDPEGGVTRLFTTNRWVTGENWREAVDVIAMLDHFAIDHARPSWPVNRWITATIRLFRPHIEALLLERDAAVDRWAGEGPRESALEDRGLEVTSETLVSVGDWISATRAAPGG